MPGADNLEPIVSLTAAPTAEEEPVGGLTGRISLGLLFIDLFFLPDKPAG